MNKQKHMGRRVKRILITYDRLKDLFQQSLDGEYRLLHVNGLPDGCKVANIFTDHLRDCLCIVIEHSSFDKVQEGAVIPIIVIEFTSLDVEVEIK